MNKPQYLAELSRLLLFMTTDDREETVSRYEDLFDQAGPEGEDALLQRIGSPTRIAIRLSRDYAPGQIVDDVWEKLFRAPQFSPAAEEEPDDVKEEPEPEDSAAAELHARIEEDLPDFGLDDLPELAALPDQPQETEAPAEEPPAQPESAEAEQAPETPDAPDKPEQAPPTAEAAPAAGAVTPGMEWMHEPDGDKPSEEPPAPQPGPEAPDMPEEPEAPFVPAPPPMPRVYTERAMPLWAGVPLFILALPVLVIPLALVCLVLLPILVLPGLCLILSAWLSFVGALWSLSYIADAAILFGVALILLAAGLVVLWGGLWLDVLLVKLYIRGVRGLSHLTLGKKVTVDA